MHIPIYVIKDKVKKKIINPPTFALPLSYELNDREHLIYSTRKQNRSPSEDQETPSKRLGWLFFRKNLCWFCSQEGSSEATGKGKGTNRVKEDFHTN